MMASPATCDGETQKMEEDGDKDGDSLEQPNENGNGDACYIQILKKNDSGITVNSYLSSSKPDEPDNSDVVKLTLNNLKDSTSDSEMKDSDWLNDSAVPSLSECVGQPKSEDNPFYKDDLRDIDTSSKKGLDDMLIDNGEDSTPKFAETSSDKTDTIGDSDELLNLDTEIEMNNPVNVQSGSVYVGTVTNYNVSNSSLSSPGAKRITTDDSDSPQPKRQTPDRIDEELSNQTESSPAKVEQTSEDLPDLSYDSDDLDEDSNAVQRRPLRLRKRKRKFLNRLRLSSDESDSSDEDEDNEDNDNKNTDDDEDKDVTEEVRIALETTLGKKAPTPNWFAVPELRRREYGYPSSCFVEKLQGSLQMVKRLVRVDKMIAHEGCVNALSFNRIGTLLASGSDDLNIVLWNWQRARPSLIYDSGHRSNVFQAKFMPFSGDCHVISCARDGQVRLAELSLTGVCKATRKLAQHRGAAHKLALELDSPNVFLSCGEDALTYLFDLRQEKPLKLVTTKENEKKVPLYSIHSNPCDSRQFCVGGRDHYIRVYDKRKINEEIDGGVLKSFCPDHLINSEIKANVTCASFNYNGTEILATYNDEDIYLFDNTMSDGASYIHKYTGHRNNATAKGVNFYGPKSEFIVSGSDCGYIYFWDKETEAIINFQEGDEAGVVNVLEPHPTLPILATSGLDHDVKLWMPCQADPEVDMDHLKKTIKKNFVERSQERKFSEPEMIGGQMLWFIMHHFRNSARRRMREEGQVLSSSDEDNSSRSEDSDTNEMQCAQS
ncbi:unnamed protein product [Lymnaea stagnalis]|uniref:DDB1- and CUL4-associated factor 8 n=1 Tax=Lymnaea stagnalis TaxID=6523 RepID=A0AAV2HH21_LYMST